MGNGWKTYFWEDVWCSERLLKEMFPLTYARAADRNMIIRQFYNGYGDNTQWQVRQRRPPYEWEIEEYENLQHILVQQKMSREVEDCRVWRKGKEEFNLKSIYNMLQEEFGQNLPQQYRSFPVQKVWITRTPSKINFFVWAMLKGRTITMDNLQKRKKMLPKRCIMCKQKEETIQHLFMDCEISKEV